MQNTQWNRLSKVQPAQNERVLVSDGEVIVIARKVEDHWIFDCGASKDMIILNWTYLPNLSEKIDLTPLE